MRFRIVNASTLQQIQSFFQEVDGLVFDRTVSMDLRTEREFKFEDFAEIADWQFLEANHSSNEPSNNGSISVCISSLPNYPLDFSFVKLAIIDRQLLNFSLLPQ